MEKKKIGKKPATKKTTKVVSKKKPATKKPAAKKTVARGTIKEVKAQKKEPKTLIGKLIAKLKTPEDGRIKLIVDSDVSNEIDDQFALAYVLARKEAFDLQAITLVPFKVTWQKNLSIRDGMIDSKNTAERILRLFGVKRSTKEPFVYFGCEGFVSEGYNKSAPAVEKIIDILKKNKEVYICCLGALTNVAMAIKLAPKLASRMHIVWMGTDNVMMDRFEDTNFVTDKEAFNIVLQSEAHFTVFPNYLAKSFVTSIYEFEKNITQNSVTQYLLSIINKFQFTEVNLGIKTIYDVGPVAYLLNKDKFSVKTISPEILVKEGKVKLPEGRKIDYITAVPKHSYVWTDFLNSINSIGEHFLKAQVFFTSDTHFNDVEKVKKHQVPFGTLEQMNVELVRRWNSKVGPNDTVYHLGDFGDYEFVKKLNGKVVLICGKHEEEDFRKNFDKFREHLLELGFADVVKDGLYLDENVLGERVYLTHRPVNKAQDCKTLFGNLKDLVVAQKNGFNVSVTYHYFMPISAETAARYLKYIEKIPK